MLRKAQTQREPKAGARAGGGQTPGSARDRMGEKDQEEWNEGQHQPVVDIEQRQSRSVKEGGQDQQPWWVRRGETQSQTDQGQCAQGRGHNCQPGRPTLLPERRQPAQGRDEGKHAKG